MKNLFDLSQKTLVILGGAGLIGSTFSKVSAATGADVVIADANVEKGNALAKELSAHFEEVDVADSTSVSRLAAVIEKKFGAAHGVVNAAYPKTLQFGKSFEDAEVLHMLLDISLHVGSCLSTVKAFAPVMRKKKEGSLVFMSSIYGFHAPRFDVYAGSTISMPAEYAAAKGGILALTRYFAALLGKDGIRVNAISPGGVFDKQPAAFVKEYSKYLKLGNGLLKSEDIAGALVFLFSDASKQMTGQNLIVDGGWTL